jgi:Family of unknown function (DUF6535)
MATLQHQWARRYLRLTQDPRAIPHDRARIREFFASGADTLQLSWEALRILIQTSLFLFFSGLLIYLFNIHRTVFVTVLSWVVVFTLGYILITFVPIFKLRGLFRSPRFWIVELFGGMENLAKKAVKKWSMEVDDRILNRLFGALNEDSDLLRFFENVYGFCRSSIVRDPPNRVAGLGRQKLHVTVKGFLERTWSSNLLSDSDKIGRLAVCVKVVDAARLSGISWSVLKYIFPWDGSKALQSIEMGQSLRSRGTGAQENIGTQEEVGLCAQTIIAGIISNVQANDDRWIALAADQLSKLDGDFGDYLEHGNDSVLLANLTYITHEIFIASLGDESSREMARASSFILPALSNFDIKHTLPELQEDFRDLWTEIDREARNNEVLTGIRDRLVDLFEVLNEDTDTISTAPPGSDPPITSSPVLHLAPTTATVLSPSQVVVHTTTDPADEPSLGDPSVSDMGDIRTPFRPSSGT